MITDSGKISGWYEVANSRGGLRNIPKKRKILNDEDA
jgi:hypothetical protein